MAVYASGVHSLKPHNEMVHAVTMNHNFGQSFENLRGFTHQGLQFSLGWGVLGQGTAVTMVRQLVESRPQF